MDVARRNLLAFLFDLDGTLVDSVYQHVNTWCNKERKIN
jgi:beta-phosphoglucomutase-like phosphatase (HAD superfamily)